MTVFVDMDGVLCDFYAGVYKRFRALRALHMIPADPWPYTCRDGDWDFYTGNPLNISTNVVATQMDRHFYANLEWTADGKELLTRAEELAGPNNVFLLSSPWDTPGCDEGKRAWIKRHIPGYKNRALIGSCKDACAHYDAVLLDDSEQNCTRFSDKGKAILVPRPWNSRHREACKETGRVRDLESVFKGILC